MATARAFEDSHPTLTAMPEGASRAEQAYIWLRDQIVTLQLAPGSLLQENRLIEDFEMSRTPIREALLRLAHEKLVVMIGRRGTFVSEVNVGAVGQLYELRCELETIAAGWAATRRRPADVPRIQGMLKELRKMPAHPPPNADNRSRIFDAQEAHYLVYELCGNGFLRDVLTSQYMHTIRIWFMASGRVVMEEPEKLLIDELEAIIAGDPDAASRAARQQLRAAESVIRAAL